MSAPTILQEFAVANVEPATTPLPEVPYHHAVDCFLQEAVFGTGNERRFGGFRRRSNPRPPRGFVESCSSYHGRLVADVPCHPLLGALHLAFAEHRPVCLSPDIIWLTLTQGLANHINAHAERLRHHFVAHEGKLALKVRRDDFVKGSPENPWPEVFTAFSQQIKGHIGETHALIVADFSTTTPVERAASEVILLDAMQAYFCYELYTVCGIPRIRLEGTTEDWQILSQRVQEWRRFDLDWWIDPLQPILDEFVAAAQGRVNRRFWDSIYKWQGSKGSGPPPYVSGWIMNLFPYLQPVESSFDGQSAAQGLQRNQWLSQAPARSSGPGLDRFPHLPARAPFKWFYLLHELEMEFVGGLVGVRQDAECLALRPEIGWAILDKQRITQIKAEDAAQEQARVEAEKARKADKEKAQVVAPLLDPQKPRFEQFFQFVCPFCGHQEKIGLWFTTKTCAGCMKLSVIHRKP